MLELNKAPVHNLSQERSVGSINNELKVRGKRNIESESRKLILNKLFDLLEKRPANDYRTFRKPSEEVKTLIRME